MLVNAVRILLDLTTVFDTVDYNILNTHCVVIYGMALNCFKSYLSCRWFSISIGSYSSKTTPLTSGVPQGSILGPLQLYTHLLGLFFFKKPIMFLTTFLQMKPRFTSLLNPSLNPVMVKLKF